MKRFTNLLNKDGAIKEIKENVNMELIEEQARWKIYAKALEWKRNNKPLEALELMKIRYGVITEQIKWVYRLVKCLILANQWKEIEPWKF
jgi:hypothetical protein